MSKQIEGRDEIFALLRENGVEAVDAYYDGQGDSGQIDSITAIGRDKQIIDLGGIQTSIQITSRVWDPKTAAGKRFLVLTPKHLWKRSTIFLWGA